MHRLVPLPEPREGIQFPPALSTLNAFMISIGIRTIPRSYTDFRARRRGYYNHSANSGKEGRLCSDDLVHVPSKNCRRYLQCPLQDLRCGSVPPWRWQC